MLFAKNNTARLSYEIQLKKLQRLLAVRDNPTYSEKADLELSIRKTEERLEAIQRVITLL